MDCIYVAQIRVKYFAQEHINILQLEDDWVSTKISKQINGPTNTVNIMSSGRFQ